MSATNVVIIAVWFMGCVVAPPASSGQPTAKGTFQDPQLLALVRAIERDDLTEIESLLSQGADVNGRGVGDVTPLMWAVAKQRLASFVRLLERGANPNLHSNDGESVMIYAAIGTDPKYLRAALDHGGDPDLVDPYSGKTPIFEAITHLRVDSIRVLIERGANLNFRDRTGRTPTMLAAGLNRYDIVYHLLKADADPKLETNSGHDVLDRIRTHRPNTDHWLYEWYERVVEILEQRGLIGSNEAPS